jgi:LDH2 family malate/lactate/ureidoglycolate dehydrogenase
MVKDMSAANLFPVKTISDFSNMFWSKLGVSPENAKIITDTLLFADLRGVKSHGIVRLPTYALRVESGVMKVEAPMDFTKDERATGVLCANNGFGQVAGFRAMTAAMQKAREYGAGVVVVQQSNHFGVTAYYSMLALHKDMIGIVATNASPAIAPFKAKAPLMGTNPLSIAVPAGSRIPIVLDMSTSEVARGKIRYAALTKKSIPLGWALDCDGQPTTDPGEALKGSLVGIGGPKGSGLSLVIDILCGVLSNTALTGQVLNITDFSGPARTGHLFCAIDIAKFVDVQRFKDNIDAIIATIKALPSVDNGPVYLPGEIEHYLSKKGAEDGIFLEEEVVTALNEIASRYGVEKLR